MKVGRLARVWWGGKAWKNCANHPELAIVVAWQTHLRLTARSYAALLTKRANGPRITAKQPNGRAERLRRLGSAAGLIGGRSECGVRLMAIDRSFAGKKKPPRLTRGG